MKIKNPVIILIIIVNIFCISSIRGADSEELLTAFNIIYNAELDTSITLEVSDFILEHQDLKLIFSEGRFGFFKPVVIDSTEYIFGAYFEGSGMLQFKPPVFMEREQLYRFFHTDSLNRSFETMLLFFTPEIYQTIIDACPQTSPVFTKAQSKKARKLRERLTKDENRYYIFETLRSIIHPSDKPYLLVNVEPKKTDRIYYLFNPHRREEVTLAKHYWRPGYDFMELVCSYSQYNIDESYNNINGQSKEQIKIKHYNIDASINRKGCFQGAAEMTFEITMSPVQLIRLDLYDELLVDSIVDSSGQKVTFLRYNKDKNKSAALYLLFNRPLFTGEKIKLAFFYNGEIAERDLGEFYVTAGAEWYPSYGYNQRAVFDMRFKTDKELEFVATGNLIEKKKVKDTLMTVWKVIPPAKNVSFNIGYLKKYVFDEDDIAPVDVYFSESLHSSMGRWLSKNLIAIGKHMEKQVAEDVMNAMRIFSHHFAPYPFERMTVGEILLYHGEAFPGFLHLGFSTWINTDLWGYDRIFRAHEVAHQWWGVSVGYETYHDKWLSEGFCEYSALMYLQVVSGNDQFFDRIKDYRNDIFSARKYLFGSGEESGPIALGYRTSSTKTRGDFDLIIYKKGALVLHMLRNLLIDFKTMNEDLFFTMLKEYYDKYRSKNPTTADFRHHVEKYTGYDMGWFFDQWVYRNELPAYEFSYKYEKDNRGNYTARCRVITKNVSNDFKMYVPLEIEIDKNKKVYIRIFIDKPDYEFSLPSLPQKPKKLRLNPFESVLAKVKQ